MATNDIVTLTEARDYLGASASQDVALLAAWIEAVSIRLDDICGPVVQRTITGELHNGGEGIVRLDRRPVASVTSVVEYDTNGAATTLTAETTTTKPADAYLADLTQGTIVRRSSGSTYTFAGNLQSVSVTYVAGRAATTAAVSPLFKQAALAFLRHMWASEHGTGNTFGTETFVPAGFAVPNRVLELLGAEVQRDRMMGIA